MKIIINPTYQNLISFIKQLPVCFDHEGETIYDERNKLKHFQVDGLDIVVKRFKKPHIINRIAYSFFRQSKAERSYKHSLLLLNNKINTPAPIAYIEDKKMGIIQFSYYICIYQKEYSHIRKQMTGEAGDIEFLKKLTQFIAELHKKGIHDLDLSPGNVLFKEVNGEMLFSLVDVNRMAFVDEIPLEIRYKNFQRLSKNTDVMANMAKEYARLFGLDETETVSKINMYCQKFHI